MNKIVTLLIIIMASAANAQTTIPTEPKDSEESSIEAVESNATLDANADPAASPREADQPQGAQILGIWKTIDDKTKQPKALVEIREEERALRGKIVKLFPRPDRPANPVCDKCKGEKKDQPILGLEFLWGLKKSSDKKWEGGEILDPESGSVYSSSAELIEGGKKLKVRGYMGFSFLGRTQTWERE